MVIRVFTEDEMGINRTGFITDSDCVVSHSFHIFPPGDGSYPLTSRAEGQYRETVTLLFMD